MSAVIWLAGMAFMFVGWLLKDGPWRDGLLAAGVLMLLVALTMP